MDNPQLSTDREDNRVPRAGRPTGPVRADTAQAEQLAEWLRTLTAGITLRQLARDFPFSKTAWGDLRRGHKLPDEQLIDSLVNSLIKEPRLREVRRAEGLRLLQTARQAALGQKLLPHSPEVDATAELALRLDDARRAQLRAQETVLETSRLVFLLMTMVSDLQRRIETLQRRVSDAESPASRVALVAQVTESEERRTGAEVRLARARLDRERAEEVRTAAEMRAAELRRDLHVPEQREPDSAQTPDAPDATGKAQPGPAQERPLFEYDRLLEDADDALAEHENDLRELSDRLALDSGNSSDREPIVRGETVGRADNPATRGDTPTGGSQQGPRGEHTGAAKDNAESPPSPVRWPPDVYKRRRRRGYAMISALVVLLAALVTALTYFTPDSQALPSFYSGDRPEEVGDDGFRWILPTGSDSAESSTKGESWDVTTTFLTGSGRGSRRGPGFIDAERLHGTLQYQSATCPGSVEWKITVNGSIAARGHLGRQRGEQALNELVPRTFTKFSLAARRTDTSTCSVSLRWTDPEVTSNSFGPE
ncbi:hypothetical protein [Streptomyces phaeochromogenes]|uniref:hypothetical protein n=1 Tax=Streptomyces phaeochromogenes TaxID=1923 RepID=UPI00367931A2